MRNKPQPWTDANGRFDVRTVAGVKKYLSHKSGLPEKDIDVHKATTYLLVTAKVAGETKIVKVPGPFVYTMNESDFAPVLAVLPKSTGT